MRMIMTNSSYQALLEPGLTRRSIGAMLFVSIGAGIASGGVCLFVGRSRD